MQVIFHLHDQGMVGSGIRSGQDKEALINSEQEIRGVQSLSDKDYRIQGLSSVKRIATRRNCVIDTHHDISRMQKR